jgi:hypothetical protein
VAAESFTADRRNPPAQNGGSPGLIEKRRRKIMLFPDKIMISA